MDYVLDDVPRSVAKQLESLDGRSNPEQLEKIVVEIKDPQKADLVRAIFSLLSVGNHDGAKARIDLSRGLIKPIAEYDLVETIEVEDGEDIRRLQIGSPEYEKWLENFERQSAWYEWFLFLHPEQEKVVRADYTGPAQLSGVSGSGKTCVAVRRALRLSTKPGAGHFSRFMGQ
jgi:hypothetical protein